MAPDDCFPSGKKTLRLRLELCNGTFGSFKILHFAQKHHLLFVQLKGEFLCLEKS